MVESRSVNGPLVGEEEGRKEEMPLISSFVTRCTVLAKRVRHMAMVPTVLLGHKNSSTL